MSDDAALLALMRALSDGERALAQSLLANSPGVATSALRSGATRAQSTEFFLSGCSMQVMAGDTALHVAAASYDQAMVERLVASGADPRAANRRGATPLHAAVNGQPGGPSWAPSEQAAVIGLLVAAGADVNARAKGGVTPLHRAVRNRCSDAVRALLELGADAGLANDNGSTPATLAQHTTGRSGSGSEAAKAEQQVIVELLAGSGG